MDFRNILPIATLTIPITAYSAVYLTVPEAHKVVFPKATAFKHEDVALSDDQIEAIEKKAGFKIRRFSPEVWTAKNGEKILGYFFIDEVYGKHEFITYGVGISPKGEVLSIEILTYRETYGDEVRQESWRKQFVGKKLSDPLKLDEDIKNISGATLSSRHIADGVKRVLATFQELYAKN